MKFFYRFSIFSGVYFSKFYLGFQNFYIELAKRILHLSPNILYFYSYFLLISYFICNFSPLHLFLDLSGSFCCFPPFLIDFPISLLEIYLLVPWFLYFPVFFCYFLYLLKLSPSSAFLPFFSTFIDCMFLNFLIILLFYFYFMCGGTCEGLLHR